MGLGVVKDKKIGLCDRIELAASLKDTATQTLLGYRYTKYLSAVSENVIVIAVPSAAPP